MLLQNKLSKIGDALSKTVINTYHYWRSNIEAPFLIWQEENSENFYANNRVSIQNIKGSVDYYTHTEYDPKIDDIQNVFSNLSGDMAFSWNLVSVQFEEDTQLIHYTWEFEI